MNYSNKRQREIDANTNKCNVNFFSELENFEQLHKRFEFLAHSRYANICALSNLLDVSSNLSTLFKSHKKCFLVKYQCRKEPQHERIEYLNHFLIKALLGSARLIKKLGFTQLAKK